MHDTLTICVILSMSHCNVSFYFGTLTHYIVTGLTSTSAAKHPWVLIAIYMPRWQTLPNLMSAPARAPDYKVYINITSSQWNLAYESIVSVFTINLNIMSGRKRIDVTVASDILVNWCWVAKRTLEAAIHAVSDKYDVRLRWIPAFVYGNIEEGFIKNYFGEPRYVCHTPFILFLEYLHCINFLSSMTPTSYMKAWHVCPANTH